MHTTGNTKPQKLAIAIAFHYSEQRLGYLKAATRHIGQLAEEVHVWILTNRSDTSAHDAIQTAVNHANLRVITPSYLGHPYLLTWSHRPVLAECYSADPSFTHFLYMEDDLEITPANIDYWMASEPVLSKHNLIPGFVRFEYTAEGEKRSSDIYRRHNFFDMARVTRGDYSWVNFRYPYQGFYLMNRSMMQEFQQGKSYSPDSGRWNIREKANQGLIYENVPAGCYSRAFVGSRAGLGVDDGALVHHVPNNYAGRGTKYGSIPIDDLISYRKLRIPPAWRELAAMVTLRRPRIRRPLISTLS